MISSISRIRDPAASQPTTLARYFWLELFFFSSTRKQSNHYECAREIIYCPLKNAFFIPRGLIAPKKVGYSSGVGGGFQGRTTAWKIHSFHPPLARLLARPDRSRPATTNATLALHSISYHHHHRYFYQCAAVRLIQRDWFLNEFVLQGAEEKCELFSRLIDYSTRSRKTGTIPRRLILLFCFFSSESLI